ncbi:hypothetical protein MUK42_30887 [Musa troglodytarum]|uniref:Uncharacterized protein n=1 Tax=Musa troglodytarum TaxID=320322 RepID=A0A9E7K1C7_9LILI|nr:hypothetical protein MUK42_30887 [Musa troglodytarum]
MSKQADLPLLVSYPFKCHKHRLKQAGWKCLIFGTDVIWKRFHESTVAAMLRGRRPLMWPDIIVKEERRRLEICAASSARGHQKWGFSNVGGAREGLSH